MYGQQLGTKPRAKNARVFHRFEIEGFHFEAHIAGDDLILSSGSGWIPLGNAAGIYNTDQGPAICKYSSREKRILMGALSAGAVKLVLKEFGLGAGTYSSSFFESPAYDSLVTLAMLRPRLIPNSMGGAYMSGWPQKAMNDAAEMKVALTPG